MSRDSTSTTAPLLSVDEAAAQLGLTARHVRRLIQERRLGFFRIGNRVRISCADIEAFLRASRVEPQTPVRRN